jgi:hypothetical protein
MSAWCMALRPPLAYYIIVHTSMYGIEHANMCYCRTTYSMLIIISTYYIIIILQLSFENTSLAHRRLICT